MKWFKNFMYGRYGLDQFGNFLFFVYLFLVVLSFFYTPLMIPCYAIIIYSLIRMFSKKYDIRRAENAWYLRQVAPIKKWLTRQINKMRYRKTHKYLKCPHCHQHLRLPKGKGNISVTCPACHQQFDKRT